MRVEVEGELATVWLGEAPVARWHDLAPFDLPGVRIGVDSDGRMLALEAPTSQLPPAPLGHTDPGQFTSSDDMAYLYLAPRGRVDWTAAVDVEDIADFNLDVDHEGRIVGVEFYGAAGAPPGWINGR